MLVLGRNPGEYLVINDDIVISVVSVKGHLRLTIEAPKEVSIVRGEIYEQHHPVPKCLKGLSTQGKGR